MSEVFKLTEPTGKKVPIVVSVPHCGTEVPTEVVNDFDPEALQRMDDTDWFVDKLYDFAPSLGCTMISAKISRWVIDLNRDPSGKPLYHDGRIITGLCPTTDFFGKNIYADGRSEVDEEEIERRMQRYFVPYHNKLAQILEGLRQEFGRVLLWDCHSIRQYVPTIHREKFPDLILGTVDGTSASGELVNAALEKLGSGKLGVSHNYPFKGGFITRRFGTPRKNAHALQLEMPKVNYMDDSERMYDAKRADDVRNLLTATLVRLTEIISA